MVVRVFPLPPYTFQVSFNVVPLFTNFPVDAWHRIACDCLRNDSSLTESSLLLRKETQTLLSDHAGVVYHSALCIICPEVYIDQTGRTLQGGCSLE